MIMETIQLRGNTATNDRRLDRIPQFDPLSRNYPIAPMRRSARKLRSYTWRCYDWFDQGREGACVAFGLGHELAARPSEVRGLDYNFLLKKIYWEAQKIDYWSGGSYPGASPRYEGTSVLAGVKVVKRLNYIKQYRWAFGLEEALYGIGHNGPAVIGVNWREGMLNTDSSGYIRNTGRSVGGHCVLVYQVDMRNRRVTIRNSWGKGWGRNGNCYVTFKDFEAMLQDRGECCFLLNRTIYPHRRK